MTVQQIINWDYRYISLRLIENTQKLACGVWRKTGRSSTHPSSPSSADGILPSIKTWDIWKGPFKLEVVIAVSCFTFYSPPVHYGFHDWFRSRKPSGPNLSSVCASPTPFGQNSLAFEGLEFEVICGGESCFIGQNWPTCHISRCFVRFLLWSRGGDNFAWMAGTSSHLPSPGLLSATSSAAWKSAEVM